MCFVWFQYWRCYATPRRPSKYTHKIQWSWRVKISPCSAVWGWMYTTAGKNDKKIYNLIYVFINLLKSALIFCSRLNFTSYSKFYFFFYFNFFLFFRVTLASKISLYFECYFEKKNCSIYLSLNLYTLFFIIFFYIA